MKNYLLYHIRLFALVLMLGFSVHESMAQAFYGDITAENESMLFDQQNGMMPIAGRSILGDANNDRLINMSDVTTVINYILNKPVNRFVFINADVTKDGLINMGDVTAIINIILHGGSEIIDDPDNPTLPTEDPEGNDPGTGI